MNDALSKVVTVRPELAPRQAELVRRVAQNAATDGLHATLVPALSLIRTSTPSQPLPSVQHPSLSVVVQGRNRVLLGDDVYVGDRLNYLVAAMTLPVIGQVVEASPAHPWLCLRVDIDPAEVEALLRQLGSAAPSPAPQVRALLVERTSPPLLDAVLRLLRLLDAPEDVAVLAPLALRELHYRMLVGEAGPRLRSLCDAGGPSHRIARAIELLKARYAGPLPIGELAAAVHLSPSSLHQRFKAATALSPLQFQKQLRLHEARRLMLVEGLDAAVASQRVGYESPSQFNREYRRLFGAPPRREVRVARATGA